MAADSQRNFGEAVHRRRVAAGLTQEELAERCGLSVRAISNLERGKATRPRRSTVSLLTAVLGSDDPDPDLGPGRPEPARAGPAPPRQLPAALPHFVGRDRELAELTAAAERAGHGPPGTVVIAAIIGTAGVGKTALAVQWAHRLASRFPDGQLYINLGGFGPSATLVPADEAIRRFLQALGIAPEQVPARPDAREDLYRSMLASRRTLIVLDNAHDARQVRPLLPGHSGCVVVVTSRSQLAGLVAVEGAHPVTLDVLAETEARTLLALRLGAERVAADGAVVTELIRLCARLPLALAIAAARATLNPGHPLAALVGELRDVRGRLDALDAGEAASSAATVFSWSYRSLTPVAARMFRLLSVHPGPDISAAAAASLTGLPEQEAHRVLAELVSSSLLTEQVLGRFTYHDLLRTFAVRVAETDEPRAGRDAAIRRVLDFYVHSAHAADRLLYPSRDPVSLADPADRVSPEQPADDRQALAWFVAEHKVLIAAVACAAEAGLDSYAWQLPWYLSDFLDRQGHWDDWAAVQRIALDAANSLGDLAGLANAHRGLGAALMQLARYGDARDHFRRAAELYWELGDRVGQARANLDLAWAAGCQGSHRDARDYAGQALNLFRAVDHRAGQGRALNLVGWYQAQLGHYAKGLPLCERAARLCRELGDLVGEAAALDSIGYICRHLGDHSRAIACFQRALDLTCQVGDHFHQADVMVHLGDAHHAADEPEAARRCWQQALGILDDLHHADADKIRAMLGKLDQP
jgi:tetratricopeptide (TPR) repeat protein/transcriptional regulator with XRE-family HTH domain